MARPTREDEPDKNGYENGHEDTDPMSADGVSNEEILDALERVAERLDQVERDLQHLDARLPPPRDGAAPLPLTEGMQTPDQYPAPGPLVAEPSQPAAERRRGRLRPTLTLALAVALFGTGALWIYREGADRLSDDGSVPPTATESPDETQTTVASADPAPETGATDDAGSQQAAAPQAPEPPADAAASGPDDATGTDMASAPPAPPEPAAAIPEPPSEPAEAIVLAETMADLPGDAPAEIRTVAEQALAGDPRAQNDLGTWYAVQQAPADYERAVFWYRQASAGGFATATFNLGVLVQRGQGVDADPEQAFAMFLEAADEGNSHAQNAVGLAYLTGNGVQPDPVQAATWFTTASANSNPRGAFYLGWMFENGVDGAPDLESAAAWYRVAAEAGDEYAASALAEIEDLTGADAADAAAVEAAEEADAADATEDEVADAEPAEPAETEPAAEAEPERELTRDDIREVQRHLTDLGYDPGPADGLMGARTESAIQAFQEADGLEADGAATPSLLDALRAATS